MWTFVLSLIGSIFAFATAYEDHGETWRHFKHATNKTERRAKQWKLTWLWGTPAITLVLSVIAFVEATSSSAEIAKLSGELSKYAPRTITLEQKNRALSVLKTVPAGPILVRWPDNDPEVVEYANQIVALLREAGLNPELEGVANMYGVFGVECAVKSLPASEHALLVAKALTSAEIATHLQTEPQAGSGRTEIWVGPKPLGRTK